MTRQENERPLVQEADVWARKVEETVALSEWATRSLQTLKHEREMDALNHG